LPLTSRSFLMRHAWAWLVPLSVVLAVLLLEGTVRLFPSLLPIKAQQRLLFLAATGGPKTVGDPYLGFTYPPFFKTELITRDYRFMIETDEHGFRNRSPWPDRAEVVIVGDSMAYGYGVAKEQAWPTLLDDALPVSRVITLGMPGTVPQQYTRYFERFGAALHPKVLIYTIFAGNDISEAPVFDQWLADGSLGNYDVWREFQGKPPSVVKSFLERSYLVLALDGLKKSLRYGFSSITIQLADGGKLSLAPSRYASTIAVNKPGEPGFDSIVRATREAKALADAIGCHFIVLFVPTAESVYLPLNNRTFARLSHPLQEALAREQGIATLNLTDPFTKIAARGQTLFFQVDGHPNALGNRVMADYVAQYLRSNAQTLGLDDWNQANPPSDPARAR
jgi:lysophospholipase L1-like esterase